MIHSMTGFARAETQHDRGQLRWELRSVNHRYLDMQFRLPEGFRSLEPEFRAVVAGQIKRGKVDATLNLELTRAGPAETRLNQDMAQRVIAYANSLGKELGSTAPLDPLALLRWPGVVEEQEPDLESLSAVALDALRESVIDLRAARAREGEKIHQLLEGRCAEILRLVGAVQARLPDVLSAIRDRLTEKVETLASQANPERLEQELVILAQKLDVSEELERLQAHVAEVRAALSQDEPVGRRLDFLMQELNREANTLASKSADAETTRYAVDLKVVIEQMREQVQNVE
ncbi:MAG: YicC/YloC family endoribonuclease [Gammaproteobacteria bacterium]|nr:YicC/YloC family endoribonuclease [Gammaproteobacteria bacterium]